ncbi:MAG TPA: tail-specific protease, partial [Firmicutes bacterium]|nr:tail-specific protease [Bacillota bacterium]
MKRLWLKIGLVVAILVLFAVVLLAKEPSKEKGLAQFLFQSLEAGHYNPRVANNDLGKRIYTLYLKSLDPNKRFFLKSDIEELRGFQSKIDDELRQGSSEFYDSSWDILQKRLKEVNELTQDILKKPFDFSIDDNFETDPEKIDYSQSSSDLKERWRLYLKDQTLLAYYDLITEPKENGKFAGTKESFDPVIEERAREKVAKNLKNILDRMQQENDEDRVDEYLNAIANSFDPHTEYMAPQGKDDFDIALTGTLEGIGATLKQDGEYIKVVEIVPGSPAWRQKVLQADDTILKVSQGSGEPVDIVGMQVTDAVKLIRGKKGTEVRLTVRKPDGRIVLVPIVRDVVVIEETYAKSAIIINGKTAKKYGYVYLPSFYRDYKTNSRNSADDVRAE